MKAAISSSAYMYVDWKWEVAVKAAEHAKRYIVLDPNLQELM